LNKLAVFPGPNLTVFWGLWSQKNFSKFTRVFTAILRILCFARFRFLHPGNWIPHYGLAMEINEPAYISKSSNLASVCPTRTTAWITEIGLISFRPVRQLLCVRWTR